jgi:hypothetical protein
VSTITQCLDLVFSRIISGNVSSIKEIVKSLNSVNKNIFGVKASDALLQMIQSNNRQPFMLDAETYAESQNKLWAIAKLLKINLLISFLVLS